MTDSETVDLDGSARRLRVVATMFARRFTCSSAVIGHMSDPRPDDPRADASRPRPPDADARTACSAWDNGECTGTPHCPPRCPRFVDKYGTPWLIRPPETDDRESLVETYLDFGPDQRSLGLPPATRSQVETWVGDLFERGRNFVAVADGEVRGHSVYTPAGDSEPQFAVFVHPDAQGAGVGTELCRHAIASAADADRDALVLDVARENRGAIRIYRRLGFEAVDSGGDGVSASDSMRMRLDLSREVASEVQLAPARR